MLDVGYLRVSVCFAKVRLNRWLYMGGLPMQSDVYDFDLTLYYD